MRLSELIEELKRDYSVIVTEPKQGLKSAPGSKKYAVVFSSEKEGIPKVIRKSYYSSDPDLGEQTVLSIKQSLGLFPY